MIDVSIIIPTYNRWGVLQECIQAALISLRNINGEIIVVDDGSTDDTRTSINEIRDSRLRYYRTQHISASHARNVGLSKARGRVVKFVDSDDLLLPGMIEKEIDILYNTNSDVVISPYIYHNGNKSLVKGISPILRSHSFLQKIISSKDGKLNQQLISSAVRHLLRRDFLIKNNILWRSNIPCYQDCHFLYSVAFHGATISSIQVPTILVRGHSGFQVSKRSRNMTNEERIIHTYLPILETIEHIAARKYILTSDVKVFLARHYYHCAKRALPNSGMYNACLKKTRILYPQYIPKNSWKQRGWKYLGPYRTDFLLYTVKTLYLTP